MKINDILNEADISDGALRELITDYYFAKSFRLYMGLSASTKYYDIRVDPHRERKPKDTQPFIHALVNLYAKEKFGIPVRNLPFISKSASVAATYGDPYVVIPEGLQSFYYNPKVEDFTERYDANSRFKYDSFAYFMFGLNNNAKDSLKSEILESALGVMEHKTDFLQRKPESFGELESLVKELSEVLYTEYTHMDRDTDLTFKQMDQWFRHTFFDFYGFTKIYVNGMVEVHSIRELEDVGDEVEIMVNCKKIILINDEYMPRIMG